MPVSRPPKATLLRVIATITLCLGANLALMQAAHAMNVPVDSSVTTVGGRLSVFAPALFSLTLTTGLFGVVLGMVSLIEKPAANPGLDLNTPLSELLEAVHSLHRSVVQRPETPTLTPAPPIPKPSPDQSGMERVIHLLEELREISLMDEGQRSTRLQQHTHRRKEALVARIDQHIRREEWSQADELLTRIEQEYAQDAATTDARRRLESGRAEAEAEALARVRLNVEDLMAVSSWDQAYSAAESFAQNFPHNADGQTLLARVQRERDVFRDSAVQRLYDQIKRDLEHREWRKALAGAQRLLERFPDHHKTNKTRQLLRTIQDNAEIEERQEQESRIQQLIKSKRFSEAISLGEDLIRRFPVSPQADAMEELLPKLRDLAIRQEAEKL